MEYIILVIVGVVAGFFAKNWIRDALISEGVRKDSAYSKEQQLKEAEVQDIKKVIEKTKQDETNRPPEQVEDFWNKK